MSKISLYYKNITAEVVGEEHGITKVQFDELAQKTLPAIAECNQHGRWAVSRSVKGAAGGC